MNSNRVMESALEVAQNLLRQSLPTMHNLPDAATGYALKGRVKRLSIEMKLGRSKEGGTKAIFLFAI